MVIMVTASVIAALATGVPCRAEAVENHAAAPTNRPELVMLEEQGFLKVRREGRKRLYSVADPRIYERIEAFLKELSELLGR